MAFISTPNVARVAMRQTLFSQLVINTLWFENPGGVPYDAGSLASLIGDCENWYAAALAPVLSDDISLVAVDAVAQDALDAPSVTIAFSTPGENVAGSEAGNVCQTVKFNTSFRGRSGRGRNYVSGIPTTVRSGNTTTLAFRTSLQGAYDQIPTLITAGDHVVVSFQLDGVVRSNGFVQPVIGYEIVDANLDSQRRRLTGRGD